MQASQADGHLTPGAMVIIAGLVKRDELNGALGQVLDSQPDGDRYPVMITPSRQKLKVKRRNLQRAALDALVRPAETRLFREFADSLVSPFSFDESLLLPLRETLAKVLDCKIFLHLRGSSQKGTAVRGSDVDILVESPGYAVSNDDKERVAVALRELPQLHRSHVRVKTLAINLIASGTQVDLVFAHTLEYGSLPTDVSLFADNHDAQLAARTLKVSVRLSMAAVKVPQFPCFLLELLVLKVQQSQQEHSRRCTLPESSEDGAMRLFVASLQALVDTSDAHFDCASRLALALFVPNYEPGEYEYPAPKGADIELSAPGRAGPVGFHARVALRRHAASMLSLFCASRIYSPDPAKGFVTPPMLELWVRNLARHEGVVSTPIGDVPLWITGRLAIRSLPFMLICYDSFGTEGTGGSDGDRLGESLERTTVKPLAEEFRRSSFGKYCPEAMVAAAINLQRRQKQLKLPPLRSPLTRCDPTALACWGHVHQKNPGMCLIVDPVGRGDYSELHDAIEHIMRKQLDASIILLAGTHYVCPCVVDGGRSIQLIGESLEDVKLVGEYLPIGGESARTRDERCIILVTGRASLVAMQGLSLCMLNQVDCAADVHCAGARDGATLMLKECSARASSAALYAEHASSSLVLHNCQLIPGGAAGCLVDDGARLAANGCSFIGLMDLAVEIRGRASCTLKDCSFERCKAKAVGLWMGGASALLVECKITACGSHTVTGAVHVSSGKLEARRCLISDNAGDGVVVQADEAAARDGSERPELVMSNCILRVNGQNGVAIYGGCAQIEDSRFQENFMSGVAVAANHTKTQDKLKYLQPGPVQLARNTLIGNKLDLMFSDVDVGHVKLDANNASPAAYLKREKPTHFTVQEAMKRGASLTPASLIEHVKGNNVEIVHVCAFTGEPVASDQTAVDDSPERKAAEARTMHRPAEEGLAFANFDKQALTDEQARAVETCRVLEQQDRDLEQQDLVRTFEDRAKGEGCPDAPSGRLLSELKECSINDLAASLNDRARGRILYGTLCTEPIKQASVMTVIADGSGRAVRLAMYHLPVGRRGGFHDRWRECFPIGMRLGIKEPFLKRYANGGCGLRVDFESDLVFVTRVCSWPSCMLAEPRPNAFERAGKEGTCYCSRKCQRMHKKQDEKACKNHGNVESGARWLGTLGYTP